MRGLGLAFQRVDDLVVELQIFELIFRSLNRLNLLQLLTLSGLRVYCDLRVLQGLQTLVVALLALRLLLLNRATKEGRRQQFMLIRFYHLVLLSQILSLC